MDDLQMVLAILGFFAFGGLVNYVVFVLLPGKGGETGRYRHDADVGDV